MGIMATETYIGRVLYLHLLKVIDNIDLWEVFGLGRLGFMTSDTEIPRLLDLHLAGPLKVVGIGQEYLHVIELNMGDQWSMAGFTVDGGVRLLLKIGDLIPVTGTTGGLARPVPDLEGDFLSQGFAAIRSIFPEGRVKKLNDQNPSDDVKNDHEDDRSR